MWTDSGAPLNGGGCAGRGVCTQASDFRCGLRKIIAQAILAGAAPCGDPQGLPELGRGGDAPADGLSDLPLRNGVAHTHIHL